MTYNLPGALAHRNAFYELAGGDALGAGYTLPQSPAGRHAGLLRGETVYNIVHGSEASLQTLSTKPRLVIELETTNFKKTLRP